MVDRTADIESSKKLSPWRGSGFGGTSCYSPDLVLVNEFVRAEFIESAPNMPPLVRTGESAVKGSVGIRTKRRSGLSRKPSKGQVRKLGSDEFKLVEILDK